MTLKENRAMRETLGMKLRNLGRLPVRECNYLEQAKIVRVRDLVRKREAEILQIKGVGRKTLVRLRVLLDALGLCYGMKFDARGGKSI